MYASPRENTGFVGHSAGGFAETGEALVSSVDKVTFVGSTADPGHMNLLLAQFSRVDLKIMMPLQHFKIHIPMHTVYCIRRLEIVVQMMLNSLVLQ